MRFLKQVVFAGLAASMLASAVYADVYLHFPPGCNDRNREQKDNRDNERRLWDSENNGKGGYPYCGSAQVTGDTDGHVFYTGSKLRVEWTLQHSCGPDANALCNTVLQYMCSPELGDGYPTGPLVQNQQAGYLKASFNSTGQNQDGTNTIPFPSSLGGGDPAFGNTNYDTNPDFYTKFYSGELTSPFNRVEFGYHETFNFYKTCVQTQRNKGLYIADRKLNGNSQRFTRQNPGGTRHGLECPEERDYYPHWSPSPWVDIAVFTSNKDWCPYYLEQSENQLGRWYCKLTDAQRNAAPDKLAPINEDDCKLVGGVWTQAPSHNLPVPQCLDHPVSRDNHLGNVVSELETNALPNSDMATFDWIIPEALQGQRCTIRLRYNMSSADYNSMNWLVANNQFDEAKNGEFTDRVKNCETTGTDNPTSEDDVLLGAPNAQCLGKLTTDVVPLYNRPFVSISTEDEPKLGIAFNTNQIGRTFEDRSYVFRVQPAPVKGNILNLNMRGCRGNIVQCYPSVEFDFVPNNLVVTENDHVHIQFCGSDFTPDRNPNNGEGWRFSARTNMMQTANKQMNFPLPVEATTLWDKTTAKKFAFVGMELDKCDRTLEGKNDNTANNDPKNCAKLNPSPAKFDGGLVQFKKGTYHYMSTRNNNFSNRSHKGVIQVNSSLSGGEITGIVFGVLAAGVALAGVGLFVKSRRHPGGLASKIFPNNYTSVRSPNTV